jgi:two-component system nitrate/nitrite response regulator NarP
MGISGPSSRIIDVGLADANPLMLGALSEFFDQDPRFSLVFTARTAEGFLDVAQTTDIAVGVIDWSLPTLGGRQLIEVLRARSLPTRLIVYADGDQGDIPRSAMSAGAAGFCARSEPPERLLSICIEVAEGQMVFPFLDVRALSRDPIDLLTDRERLLLQRLSTGLSNKDLAEDLGVSINTIKFHLRNLYEKLSVSSRTQAIARYFSQTSGRLPEPRDSYRDNDTK